MRNNRVNLIEGNIIKSLISLSLPIILTNFIQTAYGMVDMIWIGKLGSDGVAAIGTASFFINLASALVTLIVVGTGVKVAQSIGAGKEKDSNEYIGNSFVLIFILSILYSIITFMFKEELIGFYELEKNISKMAIDYLAISIIGIIFMYFNTLFSTILNSLGDSRLPFKANTIGFGVNIVLDPILIFGFGSLSGLGVVGAAIATLLSRIIVFLIFIKSSREIINILKKNINVKLEKAVEVIKMGIPIAMQRVIFIFISMVIAKIIVKWGAEAIAVQKVGVQIESISYMTIGGLQGAIAAFIGQNYGAGNLVRVKEGYKKSIIMATGFGVLVTILFLMFPKQIFSIFMSESNTLDMGANYMRILGLSQVFMCMELLTVGAFNGIGRTYIPPIISILFSLARIPMAIWLSNLEYFGLDGVWISISLSSFFKGTILVIWFLIIMKKIKPKNINSI